ncbi:MAG: hypothetical protein HOP19_01240 [Acidobacteria bacterium]|nr:hypothetical protein [Acidobacteriota bacterium]
MGKQITRKHSQINLLVCLLLFNACSSAPQQTPSSNTTSTPRVTATEYPSPTPKLSPDKKLTLYIPKDFWVDLFFEAINERANKAGLSPLKTSTLPDGDLELRVWDGFGVTLLNGFVLKKKAGQWSAIKLIWGRDEKKTERVVALNHGVAEPAGGWDKFWQQLVDEGILSLPDASQIDCEPSVLDGTSCVVELNLKGVYRTYKYGNPDYAECAEAKKMMKIACQLFGNMCGESKQ